MLSLSRILLVVTAMAMAVGAARAQTGDKPKTADAAKDYHWEEEAKKHELGHQEIKLLRQNKFVISGDPRKQIFQPYLSSDVPVFITTDSLLAGFHVLLEESIYRLEQAHARKLPGILDVVAKNLDPEAKYFKGDSALLTAARMRANVFLGVARNLLDDKTFPADADFKTLVQEEVKRVIAAKGISKPAWLGPPDKGFVALDYSRFLPRGFYTKSPNLERYFRGVSWLQAIPFRLENDEELAAFLLMHKAAWHVGQQEPALGKDFWRAYRQFLGAADDWDLPSADWLPEEMTKASLEAVRKRYRAQAKQHDGPQINDQFAVPGPGGKRELTFRFLSAYRIPDGVLFQRTMAPALGKRDFPTGLEISAALGSPFARKTLAKDNPKLLKEIDDSKALFKAKNLYAEYLQCLAVLLDRTEPDAPAFFHNEAWQIKTCQTALAGWAQMRHTFALQAKQGASYLSESICEPGFVEPVPEFYSRLAMLVNTATAALNNAGAFDVKAAKDEMADDLRAAFALVAKARKEKKSFDSFSAAEKALLAQFDPRLNYWDEQSKTDKGDAFGEFELMLKLLPELEQGKLSDDLFHLMGWNVEIASQWTELARLCQRLEIMAHKQLRQVPFNEEERYFLQHYGKQLAGIMLYAGNSYSIPRDDAPRIIDVFSNPQRGQHLLVGTAKPRLIWVLYPVKGVDILCRGAVLPYHEFANSERLTNADWKALLDSPQAPQSPAWTQSVAVPHKGGK